MVVMIRTLTGIQTIKKTAKNHSKTMGANVKSNNDRDSKHIYIVKIFSKRNELCKVVTFHCNDNGE